MSMHKKKLDWCLAKKSRMTKIKPSDKLSEEHITKAKHNLKAMDYNIQGGFSDFLFIFSQESQILLATHCD